MSSQGWAIVSHVLAVFGGSLVTVVILGLLRVCSRAASWEDGYEHRMRCVGNRIRWEDRDD